MIRACIDGYIFGMAPGGGIARYWTEVIRASAELELPIQFDVVVAPGIRRLKGISFRMHRSFFAYWAAFRADIFHSTYYTRWPRIRCSEVTTVYDFVDASFPLLHPNREGFVERQFASLRQAAVVIAISKSTRDLAVKLAGIDPARVFVAYPAVAESFAQPVPSVDEIRRFCAEHTGGAPYLVHVGNRKNYKNFRMILKAYCRAVPGTDRHLLVLGGQQSFGEEEVDWIFSAHLQDRIHFLPQVDDATLRLAYAGADALVHASRMEGFGIPVIEALACGTGLILSDIPVYREIAEGYASFVEVDNLEAWVRALQAPVAVQPAWREEVLRRYTWDEAARIHVQAYESALL